jgi:hypothetical protein
MGTSRSIGTPSGGGWSAVRSDITAHFRGSRDVSPGQIVSGAIAAAGGLGFAPHVYRTTGQSGGGGGGGASGHAARIVGSVRRTGRAVSGLGGFAGLVQTEGLGAALSRFNLGDLAGKPTVEVVARVAEELSKHADGVDGEVLRHSLQGAILEAAGLEDALDYQDLETGLQNFLNENGVAGLVELFLARYVFEAVWAAIEGHAADRSPDDAQLEALMSAVDDICRQGVRLVLDEKRREKTFDNVNWFGADGQSVAEGTVKDILDGLGVVR